MRPVLIPKYRSVGISTEGLRSWIKNGGVVLLVGAAIQMLPVLCQDARMPSHFTSSAQRSAPMVVLTGDEAPLVVRTNDAYTYQWAASTWTPNRLYLLETKVDALIFAFSIGTAGLLLKFTADKLKIRLPRVSFR